jgi:hypothetical protein
MGSENNDHQQTALTEDFDRGTDTVESESGPKRELQELVDRYLTSQRTTGSQAYAIRSWVNSATAHACGVSGPLTGEGRPPKRRS